MHKKPKHSWYEVFYSQNKDLLLEVYNNIVDSYNKNNLYFIKYEEKEKCLTINNFIKDKTINKNKKGFYKLTLNKINVEI